MEVLLQYSRVKIMSTNREYIVRTSQIVPHSCFQNTLPVEDKSTFDIHIDPCSQRIPQ